MARQVAGFIEGTYDDITFYRMEGKYFARMKSSLTGEQFWTHKAFAGSRKSCSRFGRGNEIASMVYKEIPEGKREYKLFCKMKSVAIRMIKEGRSEDEVFEELRLMKPVVRRKVVGQKKIIRQLVNSTIRQWEERDNLKMRGCENLKMGKNGRIRQLVNSTIRQWEGGDNLKMRGFEDLKMGVNRGGRRGRGGGRLGSLQVDKLIKVGEAVDDG